MAGFSFTYSKLKNVDDCPRRHYEVDIAKNYKDGSEGSEQIKWGNHVHDCLAKACSGVDTLPAEMAPYQKWVDRINKWKSMGGTLLVEQKLAITKTFEKASWFAPGVWHRSIGDVIWIKPPIALALDWKTGKVLDAPVQLGLLAQCIFVHYPDVHKVGTEFVWLKEDTTTGENFDRNDMKALWKRVLPRVNDYEARIRDQRFEPKPGGLCKRYCPVTSCPHHGKGTR